MRGVGISSDYMVSCLETAGRWAGVATNVAMTIVEAKAKNVALM